jgi:hypothetical protein
MLRRNILTCSFLAVIAFSASFFQNQLGAQTTLVNPNIVGDANLITTDGNGISFANDSDVPNRIFQGQESAGGGCSMSTDEVLQLGFNRYFGPPGGFTQEDPTKETSVLDIESCFKGSTEMNIDMVAANSSNWLRPYGFYARYDGTVVGGRYGGAPYGSGAAGVSFSGGMLPGPSLLDLQECRGVGCAWNTGSNYVRLLRQDGTAAMRIATASDHASNSGSIVMAVDGSNVIGSGFGGNITFDGRPTYPSVLFWQVGAPTDVFEAFLATGDTTTRFNLLRNGMMKWGSGSGGQDTDLYRSNTSTLKTDGSLVVGGNLAVMGQKAALVQTATYGQREVYAVESPGEWFEDFGSARLVSDRAVVKVDPMFAETVNMDCEYHVFLTASGRCSLYVKEKKSGFFKVRRLTGARDCAFDYRIVAKRRGYESVRLDRLVSASATNSQ